MSNEITITVEAYKEDNYTEPQDILIKNHRSNRNYIRVSIGKIVLYVNAKDLIDAIERAT